VFGERVDEPQDGSPRAKNAAGALVETSEPPDGSPRAKSPGDALAGKSRSRMVNFSEISGIRNSLFPCSMWNPGFPFAAGLRCCVTPKEARCGGSGGNRAVTVGESEAPSQGSSGQHFPRSDAKYCSATPPRISGAIASLPHGRGSAAFECQAPQNACVAAQPEFRIPRSVVVGRVLPEGRAWG